MKMYLNVTYLLRAALSAKGRIGFIILGRYRYCTLVNLMHVCIYLNLGLKNKISCGISLHHLKCDEKLL